jgi:WD40 repeat protein
MDTLPDGLYLWSSTTLIGVVGNDSAVPRSLLIIDVASGRVRCRETSLLTGFFPLYSQLDADHLGFQTIENEQTTGYSLNIHNCERTRLPDSEVEPPAIQPPPRAYLSPDGRYAYHTVEEDANGSTVLYPQLFDMTTGEEVRLHDEPIIGGYAIRHRWSPNSRFIVYGAFDGGGEVFLYDVVKRDTFRLSRGLTEYSALVDWSADGRYLLFSSDTAGALLLDIATWEDYLLEANGALLNFHDQYPLIIVTPPCLPCSHSMISGIWPFEDGRIGANLLPEGARYFFWSHNQTRITYYEREIDGIVIFDLATRESLTVPDVTPQPLTFNWSAGETILNFTSANEYDTDGVTGYYVPETDELRILSDNALIYFGWSPDARYQVYQVTDNGANPIEVRLHNSEQNQSRPLFTYDSDPNHPTVEEYANWSPDSRYALFVHDPDNGFECQHLMLDAQTGEMWSPVCDGTTVQFYWLP